jgi:predicted lipid-binding transport protein (Tim44 family)
MVRFQLARLQFRSAIALLAVAATLAFAAVAADAAPRFNAGSRGTRTYMAPPPTATTPNAARPIERSMTSPGQPGSSFGRAASPAPASGGLFGGGRGLLGGLAAGFLGAGLFGMLFGHGFGAGLGGFASMLGLLLQIGLVVVVARLAWAWWQRRSQPSSAYAGAPTGATGDMHPNATGGAGDNVFARMLSGPAGGGNGTPIEIRPEDFDAFERTLGDVQTAYSKEDIAALKQKVTPEMLSYYAEELAANASRGVRNEISDVKLLQGDLAEAWREGDDDYATVAMRYQQHDSLVDRNNGRVVEIADGAEQGTEYWTFRRAQGGPWMVSAIQQTD